MSRKTKVRSITVIGRRWWQKLYGNTYHSVEVLVNGECVHKIDFAYGYGDQYVWNARQWLAENGFLPGVEQHENGSGESLWRYCERLGIAYSASVTDVARKRDL
jgi:hypothetical protein